MEGNNYKILALITFTLATFIIMPRDMNWQLPCLSSGKYEPHDMWFSDQYSPTSNTFKTSLKKDGSDGNGFSRAFDHRVNSSYRGTPWRQQT